MKSNIKARHFMENVGTPAETIIRSKQGISRPEGYYMEKVFGHEYEVNQKINDFNKGMKELNGKNFRIIKCEGLQDSHGRYEVNIHYEIRLRK